MFEKRDLELLKKISKGAILSEEDENCLEKYRWMGIMKHGMTEITGDEKTAAVNFYRAVKKIPLPEKIRTVFLGKKSAYFSLVKFRIGNESTEQEWVDAVNFHRQFQESSFFKRTRMVLKPM